MNHHGSPTISIREKYRRIVDVYVYMYPYRIKAEIETTALSFRSDTYVYRGSLPYQYISYTTTIQNWRIQRSKEEHVIHNRCLYVHTNIYRKEYWSPQRCSNFDIWICQKSVDISIYLFFYLGISSQYWSLLISTASSCSKSSVFTKAIYSIEIGIWKNIVHIIRMLS